MIHSLVRKIADLQSDGDQVYPPGLFPSTRFHTLLPYKREDDNVFFTALIVFTLQQLKESLPSEDQTLVGTLIKKATKTYSQYQNRNGLKTYNFWQTNPTRHFPNGIALKRLGFLQLPDDVDDTALIYLTGGHTTEDIKWLKQKLARHANLSNKQIRNTLPEYRHLKAYSTWFGKNMYIEFDFCVLCNLMYFIFKNRLELNEHDMDTILFLRAVILANEHFTHPFYVAPSYPKPSLILYHISRLISTFDVPNLSSLKQKIIRDILKALGNNNLHIMEKVLLSISLIRFGIVPPADIPSLNKTDPALLFKDFYFFNGGLLTAFENSLSRKLAKYDVFHLKHQCDAYNYALLLEHEVLRQQL